MNKRTEAAVTASRVRTDSALYFASHHSMTKGGLRRWLKVARRTYFEPPKHIRKHDVAPALPGRWFDYLVIALLIVFGLANAVTG